MKRDHRALSLVREESPFVTPPHILVVADGADVGAAVELAEALDDYGADAEVRLTGDAVADYHGHPDAVIFAGTSGDSGILRRNGSVCVAVSDESEDADGYDLVVSRPVNARALMKRLGSYLTHLQN